MNINGADGRGGRGGVGFTGSPSIGRVMDSVGMTLRAETLEDQRAIDKALERHAPLLLRLLLDGREACVVDTDRGPEDAQPAGLVLLARQLHAAGRTAEALNLVVHTTLDLPAMPLSRTREAVECLTDILGACYPMQHVAGAGVLRCWLQTLQVFGVVEPQQLEDCLGEMNRCCIGFDDVDDIGKTLATMKVIDGLVESLVDEENGDLPTGDSTAAVRLLTDCFEPVCSRGLTDVRDYLLRRFEQAGGRANSLARLLMRVDAEHRAVQELDGAVQRMRRCGWTSKATSSDKEVRHEWFPPADPKGSKAAEDALVNYLLLAHSRDHGRHVSGLAEAARAALEQLDSSGRHWECLVKLCKTRTNVIVASIERALCSGRPIGTAENARMRERLLEEASRLPPGLAARIANAWLGLALRPGLVGSDLIPQLKHRAFDATSAMRKARKTFLSAISHADPFVADALTAKAGDTTPLERAALFAHGELPISRSPVAADVLQMRCNVLAPLFLRELQASWTSKRPFQVLGGCFPDEDASVERYAQVMVPAWNERSRSSSDRQEWLSRSRSRSFDLEFRKLRRPGAPTSGDFGFGDKEAIRDGRPIGIRRLDLVAVAIFRMLGQCDEDWRSTSIGSLEAEIRMAFCLHANARYAALCEAAAFTELFECCPGGKAELRRDLRDKALQLLDGWNEPSQESDPPLTVDETDCDAWAARLALRLDA